jgi:hypothetical protein
MSHAATQRDVAAQTAYRHVSRPAWGLAIITWEREGKRGYCFEDGQMRVFAAAHYHLLDPIDEVAPDRLRALLSIAGNPMPLASGEPAAFPADVPLPSLDEQIDYFKRSYPGGFTGVKWQDEHRQASGRPRKRHRDPAIALAREKLTAAHLASCLERRCENEAMETLAEVLGRTDLVAAVRVQKLVNVSPSRARAMVVGLHDLLFAREGAEVRVMQWIQALTRATGLQPTCNLATAPLALIEPERFICVQRTPFLAQAAAIEPRLRLPMTPTGYAYGPVLAMVERIRLQLVERGCPPADRFDIHDFIVGTVHSEVRAEITARRGRKSALKS